MRPQRLRTDEGQARRAAALRAPPLRERGPPEDAAHGKRSDGPGSSGFQCPVILGLSHVAGHGHHGVSGFEKDGVRDRRGTGRRRDLRRQHGHRSVFLRGAGHDRNVGGRPGPDGGGHQPGRNDGDPAGRRRLPAARAGHRIPDPDGTGRPPLRDALRPRGIPPRRLGPRKRAGGLPLDPEGLLSGGKIPIPGVRPGRSGPQRLILDHGAVRHGRSARRGTEPRVRTGPEGHETLCVCPVRDNRFGHFAQAPARHPRPGPLRRQRRAHRRRAHHRERRRPPFHDGKKAAQACRDAGRDGRSEDLPRPRRRSLSRVLGIHARRGRRDRSSAARGGRELGLYPLQRAVSASRGSHTPGDISTGPPHRRGEQRGRSILQIVEDGNRPLSSRKRSSSTTAGRSRRTNSRPDWKK